MTFINGFSIRVFDLFMRQRNRRMWCLNTCGVIKSVTQRSAEEQIDGTRLYFFFFLFFHVGGGGLVFQNGTEILSDTIHLLNEIRE